MAKKSLLSTVAEKLALELNIKKGLSTVEGLKENIIKSKAINEKPLELPNFVFKSNITRYTLANMECFKITPKHIKSKQHILYLHGGAYLNAPTLFHWIFLDKLASKTGACFTVAIYPKLPQATYKECYDKVLQLYKVLQGNYGESSITFMGDSAGGGLCAGIASMLKEKKKILPSQIILISPWLDLSMTNKEAVSKEKNDVMLSIYGLKELGKMWAGKSSVKNKYVSPLYADLKGFPKTTIFVGDKEIFYFDIMKFYTKLALIGVKAQVICEAGQGHVYPLYPFSDVKDAFDKICELLK